MSKCLRCGAGEAVSHTYTKRGLQEIVQQRWVGADLAAFALAQMERAENAEAERDEARRELEAAEEALDELVRKVLVARAEVDKP